MSLNEKKELILEHIRNQQGRLDYNKRIYDILEGDLLPEIMRSLADQLSAKAMQNMIGRIAPINLLKRIVNKLSTLYSEPAQRKPKVENKNDEDLIDYYQEKAAIDTEMSEGNAFFNASKYIAIQPYYVKGELGFLEPKIRVLPPHNFIVYSDDPINPNNVTVFIKLAGTVNREDEKTGEIVQKQVYDLYSDTEFLSIDEDGEKVLDRMIENEGVNPYGIIPFAYIKRSRQELIPKKDSDTLAMTILIPLLFSDMNLAIKFMSHAILYGIDIIPGNLDLNPNAFWNIKSKEGEGSKPSIGVLKPDVDVDKVIKLIREQLSLWLESKNIRPGKSAITNSAEGIASGISLMIQEADTTEDKKQQVNFFRDGEVKLWNVIKKMHNYHSLEMQDKTKFSEMFELIIKFAEQRVIEDKQTKITRIDKELSLELTSRRKAMKELNPDLSEPEIDDLIKEIDEDNTVVVDDIEDPNIDPKEDEKNKDQNIDKDKMKE